MKKLLLVLAFVSLSGCSVIDAYLMSGYDSNEYSLANDIRAKTFFSESDCNNREKIVADVNEIYQLSYRLEGFSEFTPRNDKATAPTKKLLELSKQLKDYYDTHDKVSEPFCKLKLQQVNKSAQEVQVVLGRKPR
jgi:hypothetical protein